MAAEFLLVPNRRMKLLGLYDQLEPSNFTELLEAAENSFIAAFRKNVDVVVDDDDDDDDDNDDDDDDDRLHSSKPYRAPRKYRLVSKPPASGWIKLRICGRGATGEDGDHVPAGFGGICYNEHQFPILIYYGSLGEVDENIACLKALEVGLESLKNSSIDDLVVEGDNFRVIQWVTDSPEPPEVVEQSLDLIAFLLSDFNSVVYHIYEEANMEAIRLAEKGAVSCPIGKPEILFLEHLASILNTGEIEDENDTEKDEKEEDTEETEMGEDTKEDKEEEDIVESEEEKEDPKENEEEEDIEEIVAEEEREETGEEEGTEENKKKEEKAADDRAGPIWGCLSGVFKCFSNH